MDNDNQKKTDIKNDKEAKEKVFVSNPELATTSLEDKGTYEIKKIGSEIAQILEESSSYSTDDTGKEEDEIREDLPEKLTSDLTEAPVIKKAEEEASTSRRENARSSVYPKNLIKTTKPIKRKIERKRSVSVAESVNIFSSSRIKPYTKEPGRLGKFIDDHLDLFLKEALIEFKGKSKDRQTWADRIWVFTIGICLTTLFLLVASYFYDLFFKKPLINEKLVYILVAGMFAQIISLMIIVMKYVFSPSKDAYVYLTELVKVRKLRDGHEVNEDTTNNVPQGILNESNER